jgi:hypothetical protein
VRVEFVRRVYCGENIALTEGRQCGRREGEWRQLHSFLTSALDE